jgi:hypothetical protein
MTRRFDRWSGWMVLGYGASLPFSGIGAWSFRHQIGLEPSDLFLVAASPLLAWSALRERSWTTSRLVQACAVLLAVSLSTALLRGDVMGELRDEGRLLALLLVVAGLAGDGRRGLDARLLEGLRLGGAAAVVLALVGYAIRLGWTPTGSMSTAFAFVGPLPVLGRVPRLTGTAGASPEHMGELLVVVLAAATEPPDCRRRRLLLILASIALLLTFSSAWIGGVALALGGAARGRIPRSAAVVGLLGTAAAFSWLMNVGPPAQPRTRPGGVPCTELDGQHHLVIYLDAAERSCLELARGWPYRAPLTNYRDAKETALAAFAAHPGHGIGRAGYAAFARRRFARGAGRGASHGTFYTAPHGIVTGALASYGVPGVLGLLFLGWALATREPIRPPTLLLWGAAGLLLIGFNSDVLDGRGMWALLGLIAARQARGSRADTRSPGPTAS